MNQTFQNSAQVLSIGIFFTLMIIGLSATLPQTMSAGPAGPRRPARRPRITWPRCRRCRSCSPRSSATTRSSTSLGPHVLAGAARARPGGAHRAARSSPTLISGPFRDGLHAAFAFAIVACLIAAGGVAAARRAHGPRRRPEPAAAPIPRRLRTAELEEQHAA